MDKKRYFKVTGGWSMVQEGGEEPTDKQWEARAKYYAELIKKKPKKEE